MRSVLFLSIFGLMVVGQPAFAAEGKAPPEVGQKAADFTLNSLAGSTVRLSDEVKKGPVVLVVLRGYPGYQCPLCTRQVGELIGSAEGLEKAGASVLLVYPGPPEQLQKRAEEFVGNKTLPKSFQMLLDPDYKFTNAYGLRWDAPRETAYPSTFVIGTDGAVTFSKVSKGHGDRSKTSDVLKALTDAAK